MATSGNKRRRQGRGLGFWVAAALVIHAEFAVMVGLATYFFAPRDADVAALNGMPGMGETVEINTLDEETSRKILAELAKEEAKEEQAAEEQKKKEEEQVKAPGQVVELARPREEKRPEDAEFAAEYDSSVEKQTKKYGKFDERARQGDTVGDAERSRPATPPSQASPSQQGQEAPQKPGALALRVPGPKAPKPSPGSEGDVGPNARPAGEMVQAPTEEGGELGMAGGAMARQPAGSAANGAPSLNGAPSILPSAQELARAIGSGTQDLLKDIDDGDETALNAKKWKFASFFNRVKQQVRDHWRPAEEYRRRDPSGSIYGSKDRYTLLRVQLKADGTLANVALESPSGVEFLDDVAIAAFKEAQPFPNPPRQLVEGESGLINFRFGFYFELSGAPKMKIFRYNSM